MTRLSGCGGSPRADEWRAIASGWGIDMSRRPKLRLVGTTCPADVFDDLTALRQEQQTPGSRRRPRLTETFARIPHDRALALYRHIGGAAWVLLFELDRLILKGPRQKPGQALRCADECGGSQPQFSAEGFAATGGGRRGSGRMARERSEPVGDASLVPAAGLAPQHGANPHTNMGGYGASDAP